MYGRIESAWKWVQDGWIYRTTVPANTSATLHLKTNSIQNILLDGKKLKKGSGIQSWQKEGDEIILELGSGSYEFQITK